MATRIFAALVIMRAPFLSASIFPVVVASIWYAQTAEAFPWLNFSLALLGVILLHLSANVFNDYFDGISGTDDANNNYFLPFSGGSRSVELGLITPKGQFKLASLLMLGAVACGLPLVSQMGQPVIMVGLAGAALGFFYTAPPFKLIARRGLGELTIGLCFGLLLTVGTVAALSGVIDMNAFWMGIPLGLLTTGILWINQFPDYEADKATGKNNLVVTLGVSASRFGYAAIMLGAFVALAGLITNGVFQGGLWIAMLGLPVALHAIFVCFRDFQKRQLIIANRNTIILQSVVSLLMIGGLYLGAL
jgi:1,4-dihydroxy-2-naphthoate octaprenyltransferase